MLIFSHFTTFYGHSTGLNYCFVLSKCIIKLSKVCPDAQWKRGEETKNYTWIKNAHNANSNRPISLSRLNQLYVHANECYWLYLLSLKRGKNTNWPIAVWRLTWEGVTCANKTHLKVTTLSREKGITVKSTTNGNVCAETESIWNHLKFGRYRWGRIIWVHQVTH